jgi:putative SOS response-associated peptidase YedK
MLIDAALVDDFFEWKATKARRQTTLRNRHEGRQALRYRAFGRTGKSQRRAEWIRTFAIVTTDANELVAEIHAGCR